MRMTSSPRILQLARRGSVWWWLGLFIVAFGILGAVSTGIRGHFGGWPLRADERVLLFATTARLTDDGSAWLVPIHGWVFEPETDDAVRGVALAAVKQALRLDPSSSPAAQLEERLRWFLADNQRGKRVVVRVAGMEHAFGPTDPDGHFRGSILVPAEVAAKFARGGTLGLEATSPAGPVTATVLMPGPSGLSVISDIDDTVKVSEVRDKQALLRNTLLSEYRPVDGMPELYRRFAARGATFHFVSSSPWQLYPPLVAFTRAAWFPEATFELRRFRWKDGGVFELLGDPRQTKPPAIEALLGAYPGRRFCLVGDSGEKDPEVYGEVARRHPEQIACIFIRNVTGEDSEAPRYREAFRAVDPGRWHLFIDPRELSVTP
jgi:phosphatidate phosphatase APP1